MQHNVSVHATHTRESMHSYRHIVFHAKTKDNKYGLALQKQKNKGDSKSPSKDPEWTFLLFSAANSLAADIMSSYKKTQEQKSGSDRS